MTPTLFSSGAGRIFLSSSKKLNSTSEKKGNIVKDSTAARLEGAKRRLAARTALNPQDQLRLLDERLGAGIGAAKERARLRALMEKPPKPKRTIGMIFRKVIFGED